MSKVIKHKFVIGLASVGIILFSAGLTYFILVVIINKLPLAAIGNAAMRSCDTTLISGELTVVFSDDFADQMQDRILMANGGTVVKRTHQDTTNQYVNIVRVTPGKESEIILTLHQTPGVVSAEQNKTTCPS